VDITLDNDYGYCEMCGCALYTEDDIGKIEEEVCQHLLGCYTMEHYLCKSCVEEAYSDNLTDENICF